VRVIVLTSNSRGTASRVLPALSACPDVTVTRVVLAHGISANARGRFGRMLRKVCRIGPLGAINGLRMRAWYRDPGTPRIQDLCRQFGIPFAESPFVNCDETAALLKEANADIGLSLGNGYIAERIFTIPRYGMINVHSEVLPLFQGASSVIWPIYENVPETGFTIHQINSRIDGGDILYVEKWPIEFKQTLRETVEANLAIGRERIPAAVVSVCTRYEELRKLAIRQSSGKSYTTPSIWQFLRMVRNHRRLRGS